MFLLLRLLNFQLFFLTDYILSQHQRILKEAR